MIIVKICGGLGNQMFQYALYKKMKQMNRQVELDGSWLKDSNKNLRKTTVFDVFQVDKCFADENIAEELGDLKQNILSKIRRKLFGKKKTYYHERVIGTYDENVFLCKNAYLDGYWQSEKYFADCRNQLLKDFSMKTELNDKNKEMLKRIKNAIHPISVHVRMGDYNNDINYKIYGNICTEEYYVNAIHYFENKYTTPTFFVFSNEPENLGAIFDEHNVIIVDINDESMGWADLFLMSQCEHNIIANSTFSWWGAWLNTNVSKEIIAPKKWINISEMRDICPVDWIRM